jgi:hypothetical protein
MVPAPMTPTFDPVEPFLSQVPVNRRRVMSEARHHARIVRGRSLKLFGDDAGPLRYCATEGLDHALAREESRRRTVANGMYVASLHPLERERLGLEIELCITRNKFIGCHEGERLASRMAALSRRIAEIEAA